MDITGYGIVEVMPTYTKDDGNKIYLYPDIEYDVEEAECAHMYLDKLRVPRTFEGKELSLVGRIMYYKEMNN